VVSVYPITTLVTSRLRLVFLDLEAVSTALKLKRFVLFGTGVGNPLAISFAVKHPDCVSHLILMDPVVRTADLLNTTQSQALAALLDLDWEMYTENIARAIVGYGRDDVKEYGAFLRSAFTPEKWRAYWQAIGSDDASDLLQHLRMPVLAVAHTALTFVPLEYVRGVVSAIPDARLVIMEGRLLDDPGRMVRAMTEFVRTTSSAKSAVQRRRRSR
jgi:pimeloyl-ACP methyl ester carboxylesterase